MPSIHAISLPQDYVEKLANLDSALGVIQEFSMLVSKATLYDGVMRWSAVNSDTDWDLYGERMSLELYKSMISKIKYKEPPPPAFAELLTSDYWSGGMPYLSIAHYSDGNGRAVPGEVKELFIDGNQLKARGTLNDSPLGRAVWKSLKEDEINYKANLDADRIRISIAFLDLAHKHGENGQTFMRKSFADKCPACLRGVGEKVYLDGYLVHLALTRVPVNPRTIMEAEDTMAKKSKPETKKQDALSVLGGDEQLADEVVAASLEMKSEVLVEMSLPAPDEEETTFEVTKSALDDLVASMVTEAMAKKKLEEDEEVEEGEEYEKKKVVGKKSDIPVPITKSALELSVDKLYTMVDTVIGRAGTAEDKLQEIQPVLAEVGQAIVEVVKSSVGDAPVTPVPVNGAILEAIQNLALQVQEIGTKVATLEQKSINIPPESPRIPAPRSFSPTIVRSAIPEAASENPNSVMSISRRSVGLR